MADVQTRYGSQKFLYEIYEVKRVGTSFNNCQASIVGKQKLISFTIDTDWVHDEAIEETLLYFEQQDIPVTLFATHQSTLLSRLDRSKTEVGIHPNFNPLLDGQADYTYRKPIDDLMNIFPEAKGFRSHSLASSYYVSIYAKSVGLEYESNVYITQDLSPYRSSQYPLIQAPFHWMDSVQLGSVSMPEQFISKNADFLCLAIHPIHFFLNTESEAHYIKAKPFTKDIHELKALRRSKDQPGVRNVLESYIEMIKLSDRKCLRLYDALKEFQL